MNELRNHSPEILALRMTLAALRDDYDSFLAAWMDLGAVREAQLDATGQSDAFYRVLRIMAGDAAGACLDADEAYGHDLDHAQQFLEDWIQRLLDETAGGTA